VNRVETVTPPGETESFDLTVWLPEAGTGPGLLLIQEIYGVSDYIQAVAEDLAGLGYVVAAPDLFWRIKPGYQASHDEAGLKESLEVGSRFDAAKGVDDAAAALRHLSALPEVDGGTGIIGFCLGGSIAYLVAARAEIDAAAADLGAVVSFYGSLIPGNTDAMGQVRSPMQLHFGGSDPYIPREQVAQVEEAAAGHPHVEMHVEEEAGHAFHNRMAPMFHMAEPAARAWRRTEEFLQRHLPTGKKTSSTS
jgi:carboxymethylenebutenolidase